MMSPEQIATVESYVRGAYVYVLGDRELDELDCELVEIAVSAQTTIIFGDSLAKHQIPFSAKGKSAYANAHAALSAALDALGIDDPYRSKKRSN